ncbi:MAG: glycogen debranching enzyme N-terminal domain-containing protein [Deltaproteobacteria bacterium]|nr:MAG: glycogen debranching enzyme N-terminal domain-containing protein [Deltaproteobacteria bacterium]
MADPIQITQDPAPGSRLLKFCGDTQVFTLHLNFPLPGKAWLRTNLGYAKIRRREIIRRVEYNETPLGEDWFDTPMIRENDQKFKVTLPLCEVGHFEAKCFFLKEGEADPIWPEGDNAVLNVEPADTCCSNSIYNAFVRQFSSNKSTEKPLPVETSAINALDKAGYAVIPPSGTFRDLINELDFILGKLGCRVLLLLPIHPTPTTYGRMGRFGSPYASLSFTEVDPALAEFDPHATPLEQFIELVDAVHQRNAKILIDIAINHTGWAASLHETHPQWLVRDPAGRIEVPGAWGVRWEDLTKLDYTRKDLWQYMTKVFLKWCHRGVDGFRCDAGYMIPLAAWKYIIANVRDQYPDTVFLLEGLGGKISVTRELLNSANLNWAYSELFQNYDREQIQNYLPKSIEISSRDGIMVHFAETHDNPRLAKRSEVYARMRTALCALCSHQGAFGFANGVEWYATQKINVHDAAPLNWGAEPNQVSHIQRLNYLLRVHPAFQDQTELRLLLQEAGNYLILLRHHLDSEKRLLVVVNLDDKNKIQAAWDPCLTGMQGREFVDLLTEEKVTVSESDGQQTFLLEPGQVLCLSPDVKDLALIRKITRQPFLLPERIEYQRLRAKALEVFTYYKGSGNLENFDLAQAAHYMKEDPLDFCASLNPISQESRVVTWQWPRDLKREVMMPPDHFLLIRADSAFRARLVAKNRTVGCEESLPNKDGSFFALLSPKQTLEPGQSYRLKLSVYSPEKSQHAEASILALSKPEEIRVKTLFQRAELVHKNLLFLGTNGRGSMLRIPVAWSKLTSRYDGLLAANLNPVFPDDRWIMFARCRAWIVYQDYSREISTDCLNIFCVEDHSRGYWQYNIPTGQGKHVKVSVRVEMISGENAVRLSFLRHSADKYTSMLSDSKLVKLILRPDIESRNFHETTKAYMGPEQRWSDTVITDTDGFAFRPDGEHTLQLEISEGSFVWEPEWQYMVHRSVDAERGLDPNSDLFSPGYFYSFLEGAQEVTLSAEVNPSKEYERRRLFPSNRRAARFKSEDRTWQKPPEVLNRALDHYVVNRGQLKTVIAGYPWFLDWGRDALIFARGLIASKKTEAAQAILMQFGRFEEHGTLPNMIQGDHAANRDTSDAPLWYIVACSDLFHMRENKGFLDEDCGGRSVRQILLSIGQSFISGTPNGMKMDPESCLVFSPAHFSWMDTNHPAGSPRQGYPIEIQALWYAALRFLSRLDASENKRNWNNLSARVRDSIINHFWLDELKFLSDCLHAPSGLPAHRAEPDDALRPNQLLAITLGAVNKESACRQILAACEELLIPGAIRSLSNRPLRRALEIFHQGKLLNDPHHPYQGKYAGNEDTQRKPAYHNGTAWTWLFPSFCEAWAMTYGKESKKTALSWLSSSTRLLEQGCVGHIPEILDGDFPHIMRGCDAQSWGASELLRVWLKLESNHLR